MIGVGLRAFGAAVLALSTAGCDVKTSRYDTLADARADRLFERGWLPDILPPSTTGIRTSNDLDCARSTGRFMMAPADFPAFAAHTSEGAPERSLLADWDSVVAGYAGDGFTPWTFRDGGYTWVFFCNAHTGQCQYVLW